MRQVNCRRFGVKRLLIAFSRCVQNAAVSYADEWRRVLSSATQLRRLPRNGRLPILRCRVQQLLDNLQADAFCNIHSHVSETVCHLPTSKITFQHTTLHCLFAYFGFLCTAKHPNWKCRPICDAVLSAKQLWWQSKYYLAVFVKTSGRVFCNCTKTPQ